MNEKRLPDQQEGVEKDQGMDEKKDRPIQPGQQQGDKQGQEKIGEPVKR